MMRTNNLSRFKTEINLSQYAASLGYEIDRRKTTRASIVMWRGADKIVIARRGGVWIYFSVSDDTDRGTIIDFIQKRTGQEMAAIIRSLRSWSGCADPQDYAPDVPEQEADPGRVRAVFRKCRIARFHPYLERRGITAAVLSSPRVAGRVYADRYGNAAFPHYGAGGLYGLELKSAEKAVFVRGSVKTFWRANGRREDSKLVIAEAVIDALSYHILHSDPAALYAATGGGLSPEQGKKIAVFAAGRTGLKEVILATDNDAGGDKIAAKIESAIRAGGYAGSVRRHSPEERGEDWNDVLKSTINTKEKQP